VSTSPARRRTDEKAPLLGNRPAVVVVTAFLAANSAFADRGALSLDVGVGAAGLSLAAPYQVSGANIPAVDFEAMLGLRYALTNELEFTLAGFFEPKVMYTHDDVSIQQEDSGPVVGDVSHFLSVYGVVAGIRYVHGTVWKLVIGLEGGWCHRSYTGVVFSGTKAPVPLPSFPTDNILLQPLVGVEWAFADHWSVSLLPRFMVLIGPDATVGVSLMLSISYSWFL
jgi:hypothetical protein